MNTFYTVHVYREMRLTFPAIEATTPETAARLAAALPTYSADAIEDCDGSTYSALVDTPGDENYAKSRTVFFRADGGEIEPAPKRITNQTRAAIAEACVSVFTQHTGSDRRDALGDLFCDLMHFANQRDYDLAAVLNSAIAHFEEELADEGKLLPHLIERVSKSGRFLPAASQLLEALEYLLPHAAQEVEDRKATGIAEYDDMEEAVEKARAAVSVATQTPPADVPKTLPDALLEIRRLAMNDEGFCPYTVLELIEATATVALGKTRPCPSGAELVETLDSVRATLKLRHHEEATDDDVEDALRMASAAITKAQGDAS